MKNSTNSDKLALARAIDRACAELQHIRDTAYPSNVLTIEEQSESAQLYCSYASDVLPICSALIVKLVEIAAGLAGHELTRTDRADLTEFGAAKDLLQDIYGAATRLVEEAEAA